MVSPTVEALRQDLSGLPFTTYYCFHPTSKAELVVRPTNTTESRELIATREIAFLGNEIIPRIDQTLQHTQVEIDASSWTEHTAFQFVTDAFPGLKSILTPDTERTFFRGRTTKDYLDLVALPAAIGFRDWAINFLPESYKQRLELLNEVDAVTSFDDLLRLYGGISIIPEKILTVVFNEQMRQQVNSLLGSIYLATIVDLTRKPQDKETLTQFTRQVAGVFPHIENVEIGMRFNPVTVNILRQNDGWELADHFNEQNFTIRRPYTMRRFGTGPDQLAIFEQRQKDDFVRMLKTLRNRPYPLSDILGARFVIYDKIDLNQFISTLQTRLTDWTIEREQRETKAPESQVEFVTYYASQRDCAESKIEVQIYWIKNNGLASKSSWIKKSFMRGSNDSAYRMKQLLNAAFPWMFPKAIYGIDWTDDAVRTNLLQYADDQALR